MNHAQHSQKTALLIRIHCRGNYASATYSSTGIRYIGDRYWARQGFWLLYTRFSVGAVSQGIKTRPSMNNIFAICFYSYTKYTIVEAVNVDTMSPEPTRLPK